ncbi:MAG: magnesium transporter [Pirellulaceae bacterium]|nr:magnesium transporter [Pirellulaceae bacterium]
MINTLFLPELRELLDSGDAHALREVCTALHPARTAEFVEGLSPGEAWSVLKHADMPLRVEIFSYFDHDHQVAIFESQDRHEVAELIAEMSPDDRVDLLQEVSPEVVQQLLELVPASERQNIERLQAFEEGTAGAVMTTDIARLSESLKVRDALAELGRQAEQLETIYYIYVVDGSGRLKGVVSARQLVSAMGRPQVTLGDLMDTDILMANVHEDQESVADKVARYDLLAIPVVDDDGRLVGIVTHDDVIDVVREEATEDAHRIAAVDPLEDSYMRTSLFTLSWKRGIWLSILFVAALLTAFALRHYEKNLASWEWLVWFIPLVISSGGNSGSQTATLIITAMATGDVELRNWLQVVLRELAMGLLLGGFLGLIGFLAAAVLRWPNISEALVVPFTLLLVVICGTLCGSVLPLLFKRLGWDPALMSNPFVAGIIDILGIVIYMNVAMALLDITSPRGP